jgi:tRNA U38,U39,U40 pseudouridine synthase TruA
MTEFHPPRNDFYSVFPTLHNGHDFSLIEAFYARCLQNNGDTALPSWFRGDTEYTVTDLHAVQRHFDDAARQSLQQRWLRKMDKKKWGNMRDRDYSSNDNGDDSGNGHCSASTPTIPDMPPGLHDRIVHTSLESNIPLITCTNLIETAKNRETYALRISYLGNAYYGYQLQNGKNHKDSLSVQEDLQEHVLRRKTFAAGRTDRYVSAISQVIYFHLYTEKDQLRHTEDSDIFKRARIANILHNASLSLPCMNGKIKVNQCVQMPKPFHSLFSAKWRRYVYLLPMSTVVVIEETKRREMKYLDTHRADKSKCNVHACAGGDGAAGAGGEGKGEDDDEECIDAMGSSNQNLPKGVRMSLDVDFMNDCMSMLSAQTVHCNCFAIKDMLKAAEGEDICQVLMSRAFAVNLQNYIETPVASDRDTSCINNDNDNDNNEQEGGDDGDVKKHEEDTESIPDAICLEIVADRFLRGMVRTIVATVLRESILPLEVRQRDILLQCCQQEARYKTTYQAPGVGLCLAGVGYDYNMAALHGKKKNRVGKDGGTRKSDGNSNRKLFKSQKRRQADLDKNKNDGAEKCAEMKDQDDDDNNNNGDNDGDDDDNDDSDGDDGDSDGDDDAGDKE